MQIHTVIRPLSATISDSDLEQIPQYFIYFSWITESNPSTLDLSLYPIVYVYRDKNTKSMYIYYIHADLYFCSV